MTDKEFKQLQRKIVKLSREWRDKLGLSSYRLHHTWNRETKDKVDNCGAEVSMRWEYLEADFTWYMPALQELNDDELEETVIHEFCHILIAPLMHEDTEHGRAIYERVTTTVQRAISYVHHESD